MFEKFEGFIEYQRKLLAKATDFSTCWTLMAQAYGAGYMLTNTDEEGKMAELYIKFQKECENKIEELNKNV